MIKNFTSLHNHSHASFLDGISRPDEIVSKAKERGLNSIAITDHGHMHSVADMFLEGKKQGVRVLYGIESYVIDDLEEWARKKEELKEKEDSVDDDATNTGATKSKRSILTKKSHLVMLAKNNNGLQNLYKLMYLSHVKGMFYKPRMDKKMLIEHSKDIITTSACMGGVISTKCWEYSRNECEWKDVVNEAKIFNEIYGKDNFFLELQFNESDSQRFINDCLYKIHLETGIPLTVTNDSHYVNQDDWQAQEILYMLRSEKTIATRGDDWDFEVKQLYIKSPQEMWDAYLKFGGDLVNHPNVIQKAFENTLYIDSLIEKYEPDIHQRLPKLNYENPFKKLGEYGITKLKELGLDKDKKYVDRFMFEMKLIKDKGFANYFLIVRDIINKAREKQLIGPGRGSAAGSLICYLNGITKLDPIKHGLMFERFINPDRNDLPDIDTDFQDAEDAREMLRTMFGENNVACISTYSTFNIKGLLKDLARVYDLDHKEINAYNKKIEAELESFDDEDGSKLMTFDDIQDLSHSYVELVEKYPILGQHISKLYGRYRHVGRHACGVVIGDNLQIEMPTFTSKGVLQTSYTEGIANKNTSAMGFVKFDLLGLSTLIVIDGALKMIADRHNMTYEQAKDLIDPEKMDINDPNVFKTVFIDGNMTGIFQYISAGIRKTAMNIKPDCFEDISAIGALYRPGPLGSGMDRLYAHNKHNPQDVTYIHPLMENILSETYGCLVYQEQMLNIGHLIGKLSMKDTNLLRKLILKKDNSNKQLQEQLEELRTKFVAGCEENNLTKATGEELWEMLRKYGGYGFNMSHAKCYGMVSFQTAYLRTYYPLEFFTSLLTHGKADDLQGYVDEIKKQGFKILPVNINKSKQVHTIEGDAIRLAITSVKGIGQKDSVKLIDNQPYESFIDYLFKTKGPKTATETLLKIGAFREIEPNIKFAEKKFEIYRTAKKKVKESKDLMIEQFARIEDCEDYTVQEIIDNENELLGFNIIGNPFTILGRGEKIELCLKEGFVSSYDDFIESDDDVGVLVVLVKEIRERQQKNGQMMAFVKFAIESGLEFEAPAFSSVWSTMSKIIKKGNIYLTTFNRKLYEDPKKLIIGRQGWKHSDDAIRSMLINIDGFTL